jgi:hypothetical protein
LLRQRLGGAAQYDPLASVVAGYQAGRQINTDKNDKANRINTVYGYAEITKKLAKPWHNAVYRISVPTETAEELFDAALKVLGGER